MLSNLTTNPSIFLRLKAADAAPREFAWKEFHDRYAPIIAGFAQRLGARQPDLEDVIQDVMLGFFSKSPTFIYDPAKGRFRGYLKVCTFNALKLRAGQNAKFMGLPLGDVDPAAPAVETTWEQEWQQQQLNRALKE